MIKLTSRTAKKDINAIAQSIAKASASAGPLLISQDFATATKTIPTVITNLIDAVFATGKDKSEDLEFQAYDVVMAALTVAINNMFNQINFQNPPNKTQKADFAEALLQSFDDEVREFDNFFTLDVVTFPTLMKSIRSIIFTFPRDLDAFKPRENAIKARNEFERLVADGFQFVRIHKPSLFTSLEASLSGSVAVSNENRLAQSRHEHFILRSFAHFPIFGQEETGITVSQLYVRQRCIWNKRETKRIENIDINSLAINEFGERITSRNSKTINVEKRHVGDLHDVLGIWLRQKDPVDAFRVVAGGPGSGKSTFARCFFSEVTDRNQYKVLFIPLQEIDTSGSFDTRIANLFKIRTDLGFDRVTSPLDWLGQSDLAGTPPQKPLLLICDGLDEIVQPGSKDAIDVTIDFIQILSQWARNRNSNGCYVKALILGRNIAAREAFGKLGVDDQALLYVGGLMPLTEMKDWQIKKANQQIVDTKNLSQIDQRITFWNKWAIAKNVDPKNIPIALRKTNQSDPTVAELTTEPLLLYLLLWTGYLGDKWHIVADNRNVVYLEIFNQIYRRDWGNPSAIKQRAGQGGGHTGTRSTSFEQFIKLQEALGLSSWPSGSRIVSKKNFDFLLEYFLDEETFEEIRRDASFSVKSVAIQSYTRGIDGEEAGYEFVHKSIGEYLIGCALARTMDRFITSCSRRTSNEKLHKIATAISQIAHLGFFTSEIARFMADQVRMAHTDRRESAHLLLECFTPFINWAIKNGMPVQKIKLIERDVPFKFLEDAERKSIDVVWSYGQFVAASAFNDIKSSVKAGIISGAGPLKFSWPTPTSFTSFFHKVADRSYCRDTGRICSFSYIDYTGQVFTDCSFGSVLFSSEDRKPHPRVWLAFTAVGARFDEGHFFGSILRSADLRFTEFEEVSFSGTIAQAINFSDAKFDKCSFDGVDFSGAIFEDAKIIRCKIYNSNFSDLKAGGVNMSKLSVGNHPRSLRNNLYTRTTFENSEFIKAKLVDTDFEKCNLRNVDFSGADLTRADLTKALITSAKFVGANLTDTKLKDSVKNAVLEAKADTTDRMRSS